MDIDIEEKLALPGWYSIPLITNNLEKEEDPDGVWSKWSNQELAGDYQDLFDRRPREYLNAAWWGGLLI